MGSESVLPSAAARSAGVEAAEAVFSQLLEAEGLGDVQVIRELRLPLSSRTADLTLVGTDPNDGGISVVVVEAKQWTQLRPDGHDVPTVTVEGLHLLHPATQVWGYCSTLVDFVPALHDRAEHVYGVVYLPNLTGADLADLDPFTRRLDRDVLLNTRIFGGDQASQLGAFLRTVLSGKDALAMTARLDVPSEPQFTTIIDATADELMGRRRFTLIDQQRLAFDQVIHATQSASRNVGKHVVIVDGGPRTGKSTLGLALLGEVRRRGHVTAHATGSRVFTTTLRETSGLASAKAREIFRYFNSFTDVAPNTLDVLIADEAHRIRATSNTRYTPKSQRAAGSQVEELIDVARVSVFLLDDEQVVRPDEVGSIALIRAAAVAKGAAVTQISLRTCFGGGGEAYMLWLHRLLGFEPGGPLPWTPHADFSVRLAASPREMEVYLKAQTEHGYTARMMAGYCWPWSAPRPDGTLPADVVIGDWARPWNSRPDHGAKNALSADNWAVHPDGFEQIGVLFTAQGFEFDYAGVIIGSDLTLSPAGWAVHPQANRDPALRRQNIDADSLIRNSYRILCTRGIRGIVLYSPDPATRQLLSSLGVTDL